MQLGFEETVYSIVENEVSVTVIIAVFEGQLSRDIQIKLTTEDSTAAHECKCQLSLVSSRNQCKYVKLVIVIFSNIRLYFLNQTSDLWT